jgi:hypothetical protein
MGQMRIPISVLAAHGLMTADLRNRLAQFMDF